MSIDESWFDELLRSGDETAPENLRAQVLEMVERRSSNRERRPRRIALLISAVAAAALIIGLVIVNSSTQSAVEIIPAVNTIPENTAPPTAAPDVQTTGASSEPTVTYRDGVTWWVPTWVPDDLSFNYAVQDSQTTRSIGYGDCSPACDRAIYVLIGRGATNRPGPGTTVVDRDGNGWRLSGESPNTAATLQRGDYYIEISGTGLDIDELTRVVESVELVPETALPRPPLVCCSYVRSGDAEPGLVVSRLEIPTGAGTKSWDLRAHTDGSMIDLSGFEQAGDTFGPGYRVTSEDPLALVVDPVSTPNHARPPAPPSSTASPTRT